jgi:uncharacterized protein
MERRAVQWLAAEGLVDPDVAERAAAGRTDPDPPAGARPDAVDARVIASEAARELRALYGGRLQRLLLYGSSAPGDAHPESDIDLLVVLDDMRSSWEERGRMDDVLWKLSHAHGTVVSALPVRASDLREPRRPLLIRALADGIEIA